MSKFENFCESRYESWMNHFKESSMDGFHGKNSKKFPEQIPQQTNPQPPIPQKTDPPYAIRTNPNQLEMPERQSIKDRYKLGIPEKTMSNSQIAAHCAERLSPEENKEMLKKVVAKQFGNMIDKIPDNQFIQFHAQLLDVIERLYTMVNQRLKSRPRDNES